jgi:UDP-N-acetylmuramoyl-L-alanyl-D-glutamate--2,6-diaminopimelate ligase
MKLADLTRNLPISASNPDVAATFANRDVAEVTADSRRVRPGTVFVALPGERVDGHQFLEDVVAAGALAVVVAPHYTATATLRSQLPVYQAEDTHLALALLCAQLNHWPGQALRMVGVTGTNGKTTVTHLIDTILREAGHTTALMGTLGKRVVQKGDGYESIGHTTPMAPELQNMLKNLRQEGTEFVVMEASSHALVQHRVAGCAYEVAVITNLTQDHLDFHKTMEAYAEAKALLFRGLDPATTPLGHPRAAVVNLDDDWANTFLNACPPGVKKMTYSIHNPQACVRAEDVHFTIQGASFRAVTPEGEAQVALQLAGQFSVYNALAALATGLALGLPLHACVTSLGKVPGVRGRFEVVAEAPFVIIDYAHTPDGLENVLRAARQVTPPEGKLRVVFGCGGDRDATKRPKMGRIAETQADALVITSDNPRSEDPQQIMTDILSGIERFESSRMWVQADRQQAIALALDMAGPLDVVVVAGKGHEDYQILADRVIHFDDKEVVQQHMGQKAMAGPR